MKPFDIVRAAGFMVDWLQANYSCTPEDIDAICDAIRRHAAIKPAYDEELAQGAEEEDLFSLDCIGRPASLN